MNIQKAVKKALEKNKCITRDEPFWATMGLRICPTNSPDCCIVMGKERASCRGWQPTADDLIAEDWELTDFYGKEAVL